MTKIKTATGLIKLYMSMNNFKGFASFWDTIYLMPGSEGNEALIRHEQVHLDQIERMGVVKFTVVYVYWALRKGYEFNPLEIQARAAEAPPETTDA